MDKQLEYDLQFEFKDKADKMKFIQLIDMLKKMRLMRKILSTMLGGNHSYKLKKQMDLKS